MTRTMYDAVNVNAAIPDNPELVAGYIDGNYQSFAGLAARFPNAVHVPIAVWPSTNGGLVLDVETGDASPEQAPPWCEMRRAAGVIPSVYCGQSAWQSVRDAFAAAGVEEPPYWVASYPGPGPVMIDGAIAHQWGGDTEGGYDISIVADFWPGVDTPPIPPVPPTPPPPPPIAVGDDDMNGTASLDYHGNIHHFFVDPKGNLTVDYFVAGKGWFHEVLAGPGATVPNRVKDAALANAGVTALRGGGGDPDRIDVTARSKNQKALINAWFVQGQGWKSWVLDPPSAP